MKKKKINLFSWACTGLILLLSLMGGSFAWAKGGMQEPSSHHASVLNFAIRAYKNAPFEGVKMIQDGLGRYLICPITLQGASYRNNTAMMNRVSKVKASAFMNEYLNGSSVSSSTVLEMDAQGNLKSDSSYVEQISMHSYGCIDQVEMVTVLDHENGAKTFLYLTQLESTKK